MTRYAVGDLQGCLTPLTCLLESVNFNPEDDQLWVVGDLINRGPESLQTLRYIKNLGNSAKVVLGNHDLHFLAIAHGTTAPGHSDTFSEILTAPDRDDLVQWLLQQPLIYSDPTNDYHMVHAGIPPNWSLAQASGYAREVHQCLQSDKAKKYFEHMYGNTPAGWDNTLQDWTRLRVITNYLTRMRFCTAEGELDFKHKLTHIDREGFAPWFAYPDRLTRNDQILFGHWAALEGNADSDNVFALDTGCVWGHALTLMNLETQDLTRCDC